MDNSKKKDPWYKIAQRIVCAPFVIPALIFGFCRWKYAISLQSTRALLRIVDGKDKQGRPKEPSRFPLVAWFITNLLLKELHEHLVKQHICRGAPNCLHALRITQAIWNVCRKNGRVVMGFLTETKPSLELKAFAARDLTFFKSQVGCIFPPAIRDLFKLALQLQKDDLKFILWCFMAACELIQRSAQSTWGPVQPLIDMFVKKRTTWGDIICKFSPIIHKILSVYAECMIRTSLDFGDKEAAHLWAKAGQCAVSIRQLCRPDETPPEVLQLVDSYCQHANDGGARVYTHYLAREHEQAALEETRKQKAMEARREAEEKKEEKARRKEERKARKAAEVAAKNDPNAPKTPETVLVGRHGRFEFVRATKNKRGTDLDIHDVKHRRWFRKLTAPKALNALTELFVQYGDGSRPIQCILPLNDPTWKASFNYGDLQDFFNAELQTWAEANPTASAEEKYQHQCWYRILPDDQKLLA